MAEKFLYITVMEDHYYKKRAKELGIYYYSTPMLPPPESDAFEYSPNYDAWIEEFFI